MESESIWTPDRRHIKRKASASPLNQVSYSEVVQSTIKKVPQIPKQINVNSTKVFKYFNNVLYCWLSIHSTIKLPAFVLLILLTVPIRFDNNFCTLIWFCWPSFSVLHETIHIYLNTLVEFTFICFLTTARYIYIFILYYFVFFVCVYPVYICVYLFLWIDIKMSKPNEGFDQFLVILLLFTNFLCLIITYCEILE
jgi:hypothetical protein